MAINPNEINVKNIIELIQSSSIQDNDLLVIGQGIYARKSTVLELYNKFGVPSILTSLNSLQFQINQLNNTVGNSVLYSPQVKTPQQKADARNNLDVYSRSQTQTVVNTAIVNLGNVVNSVTSVNPALVDNSDPKNPVIAEFREISDYNNDMLNKADIDGNLTIGGMWWQDQVLSDRFANYKQVWTALSNNTIEWGNIELDKHVFLVDDINGLKIKVGGTEGTIWNTLNLTNVSQLANDAGYLQANDLDGFIYDVQYNSATHTITFYQQNEPNIVIDLPIESLIKGVQLVGDDLVFTFEDGSTVTVPLNTLLVGVVKSVNGLTPNSQGEIILNVTDIPNLSSELANKLDIRMAGLVSNLTQPEKDAIHTKLGITNNVTQVLSLSGNTLYLSAGGGSVNLGIINIGGLQTALDSKANTNGNNLTNIADWRNNLGVYSTTQVDSLIPNNYITTNTNQTGLIGDKTINNAIWSFNSGANQSPIKVFNGIGYIALGNASSSGFLPALSSISTNQYAGNAFVASGFNSYTEGAFVFSARNDTSTGIITSGNAFVVNNFTNKLFYINHLGLVTSIYGFSIEGQSDSSVLLAGGGHKLVSDFVVQSQLSNYVDLTTNYQFINSIKTFLVQGNSYTSKGIESRGNGSNLYPGFGFHQPDVYGASLEMRNNGLLYWDNEILASRNWVNNNFALSSAIPTNLSQLVNDANYTTLSIVQSWVGTQGFFQFPSGGNSGQYLNGLGQLVNFPTIPPQLVYTGSNGINVTGTVISPTYGTTSGTIAQGNDARFHNAVTIGTANGLSLAGQVLSLGLANSTNNGALSSTDWNTFNSKVSANNGQLSFTAPTGLAISGTFNANQSGNTTIPITWQAGYQGFTTAESNKLSTIENNATRTRLTGNGNDFVSGDIGIYGEGGTESRQDGTKIYLSQSSFRTEFFVYSNTSVTVPNTDTDKVIQKSGSGAITVTLSNGQRNGQKLNIKWGGTSNFTVQGNMYDSGANVSSLTMNSNSLPRLSLIWNASNGRWWLT